MLPLAPPRLSITNGCLSESCRPLATGRAAMSDGPPAGHGTITVTGLVGYACAAAYPAARERIAAAKRFIVELLCDGPWPWASRRGGIPRRARSGSLT